MSTPLIAWLPEERVAADRLAPDLAALAGVADHFEPLALEDVGPANLLDRVDTKFLVPVPLVPPLLAQLTGQYRALEVVGTRLGRYHTRYFDTPDLALYHAHQAGRLPRYKVRIRSYLESRQQYLEVKLKNNKGRTVKTRTPLGLGEGTLERVRRETAAELAGTVPASELVETLTCEFSRLTLVRKDAPERLTVDVGLSFAREGMERELPGIAVVEIKQLRHGQADGMGALRGLFQRDSTVSKYCLGVALLETRAKKNRFKRVLAAVERTQQGLSLPARA